MTRQVKYMYVITWYLELFFFYFNSSQLEVVQIQSCFTQQDWTGLPHFNAA